MQKLFGITLVAIFLDQITKFWAEKITTNIIIIPHFFSFDLQHNLGIALSIPIKGNLQIGLILLILLIGGFYAKKEINYNKPENQLILGGILGGALGNLIDRLTRGAVIDFISVWNFPVFNLADIFIFLGVFGLFWLELKKKKT